MGKQWYIYVYMLHVLDRGFIITMILLETLLTLCCIHHDPGEIFQENDNQHISPSLIFTVFFFAECSAIDRHVCPLTTRTHTFNII